MPPLSSSQVFAGCVADSVTASTSAAAFVDWKLRPSAPQPYRGQRALSTAPLVAQTVTAPSLRARSEREELRAHIGTLASRVAALQVELDRRALDPSAANAFTTAAASISARLGAIERMAAEGSAAREPVPPPPVPLAGQSATYLDSCAKYASEASRVRVAGRLPFASDHFKIN